MSIENNVVVMENEVKEVQHNWIDAVVLRDIVHRYYSFKAGDSIRVYFVPAKKDKKGNLHVRGYRGEPIIKVDNRGNEHKYLPFFYGDEIGTTDGTPLRSTSNGAEDEMTYEEVMKGRSLFVNEVPVWVNYRKPKPKIMKKSQFKHDKDDKKAKGKKSMSKAS